MKIDGKVAIVTGASGGIGEAAARLLSKRNAIKTGEQEVFAHDWMKPK